MERKNLKRIKMFILFVIIGISISRLLYNKKTNVANFQNTNNEAENVIKNDINVINEVNIVNEQEIKLPDKTNKEEISNNNTITLKNSTVTTKKIKKKKQQKANVKIEDNSDLNKEEQINNNRNEENLLKNELNNLEMQNEVKKTNLDLSQSEVILPEWLRKDIEDRKNGKK